MAALPRRSLVGKGIAAGRSQLLLAACGEKVGMRGRARESEPGERSLRLRESDLVERPPHPDPLCASGEREQRGACGTAVPYPSSCDLPGGAILAVLKHHAHGGEFVADAVGFSEVLGFAGSVTFIDERFNIVCFLRGQHRLPYF